MKHDVLRSVGHNIAASLASGTCLLIGVYNLDVFDEAARTDDGHITVDFLAATASADPSASLQRALMLYRDALPALCARHGISSAIFSVLRATYWGDPIARRFTVVTGDRRGTVTTTEYGRHDARRLKVTDSRGRLRLMPIQRRGDHE